MRAIRNIVITAAVLLALVVAGRLMMPLMARRLIHTDPLVKADLIVVLGGNSLERTAEAGMLYREGWAPRILLMRPPDRTTESLARRAGITVPSYLDMQKNVLAQMRVAGPAVALSPNTQVNTREEANAVAAYVHRAGYRTIIVVTSPYHTARARSLIRRAAAGSFRVVVHADRYENEDPDRWWVRYPDKSEVVLEYLKRIYSLFW